MPGAAPIGVAVCAEDVQLATAELHDRERYRFLDEHGRGGLGRVWRAHDRALGRDVAIKELIARGHIDEMRFMREALITARLEHPGIVAVHEAGRWPDGTPFYAMKLVSGRPLRALIAERPTVDHRLGLLHHVIAVADAMAYAHGRNIIHRDLKPANVIVGEFGETIVIDWGLAKDLGSIDDLGAPGGALRPSDDELTAVGSVLGTPAYMSPEQARGEPVDQRADVFAIGAMLWELCTLHRLLATRPQDRARELRRAGIDQDLAVIVAKAVAPEPQRRYRDAGALAADLKAFKAGARIGARNYSLLAMLAHWTRRHRRLAQSVAALVACAAAGVALYVRSVAAERDRADHALVIAQQERDRARLSEASLLLEKDPLRSKEALAALALQSPQHALLRSRAQQRSAARSIEIDAGVENLYRSPGGSEVVVVTREGELYQIDPGRGTKRLVDRDVKQGIAYHDGAWLYVRKPFRASAIELSSPSNPRTLDGGGLVDLSALVSLDRAVYGVDSLGNLYELGRRAPALVRRAVRFIAGGRDLLLTCTIDGALEVRRDDAVVLRRGCLRNLSPEMMAVAGDSFAAVTAPHVLTVSRGGRTFDAPTEIAGEYELAMSEAGVVVLADYSRGGRPSYMRADADVLQPGPVHDAPLYCVAAGGRFAAWGYRDGTVIALDTISGAVWTLRGHPDAAFHMVFVGDTLLTASAYEVRVWDLKTPPVTYVGQLPCLSRALQLSPDGAHVGLDCNRGAVWLWTRASGALVALHAHDKSSVGVAWLGDQLCSIGWDGRALCSTPDGRTTRAYETGGGKLTGLTASPDHSFVVFASPDGRIWKLDEELRELYSQEAVPAGVALAPGGTLLASGGLDGSLIVFDLATHRIVSRIAGHRGAVSGLGWRGDLLWSTGLDGTLRWWALQDGGLQPREVVHEPARIRLARVFAAGWAADVREGVLRIQSDDAPPLRFDLDKHIDSIDVSPDERYVAAGVRGEIVVVDRSRNRIATLNLESENGRVTFLDSSTLALNAAGTIGLVPVNELDYLPFVPVPGG